MYVTSIIQAPHDEERVAVEASLGGAIGRAGENEAAHDTLTAREDRQLFLSAKAALHDLILGQVSGWHLSGL